MLFLSDDDECNAWAELVVRVRNNEKNKCFQIQQHKPSAFIFEFCSSELYQRVELCNVHVFCIEITSSSSKNPAGCSLDSLNRHLCACVCDWKSVNKKKYNKNKSPLLGLSANKHKTDRFGHSAFAYLSNKIIPNTCRQSAYAQLYWIVNSWLPLVSVSYIYYNIYVCVPMHNGQVKCGMPKRITHSV